MKRALAAVFVFLFVIGGSVSAFAHPNIRFFYNDPPAPNNPGGDMRDLASSLVDLLSGAQATLDCALHEINCEAIAPQLNVVDALINAHNRGVAVRVVIEGDYSARPSCDRLRNAGITIVARPGANLMHNKFIVVDGAKVWTGSTNTTDNCLMENANNSIIIDSSEVAAYYTAEFNQMFVEGKFGRQKSPLPEGIFDLDGDGHPEVEVVFSPKTSSRAKILREIGETDSSLYFGIFSFWNQDIADAMIDAFQRGADVRGVFNAGSNPQLATLCGAVGNMKRETFSPGKLHSKCMVIDAGTDDEPVVITGSYNWSDSAEEDNDENTVIVHDRPLADEYYRMFAHIYANRSSDALCPGAAALAERYSIAGTVWDAEGMAGLAGIVVGISGSQQWDAISDEAGRYRFDTLLAGGYTVTAPPQGDDTFVVSPEILPGGGDHYGYHPLAADQVDQDFYLVSDEPETYSIGGTVADAESGDPLSDMEVVLSQGKVFVAAVLTDDGGGYEFPGLEPGVYKLTVAAQGGYTFSVAPDSAGTNQCACEISDSDLPGRNFYGFSDQAAAADLVIESVTFSPYPNRPDWRRARIVIKNNHRLVVPRPVGRTYFYLAYEPMRRDAEGTLVSCRLPKPGWNDIVAIYGSYYTTLVNTGRTTMNATVSAGWGNQAGYLFHIDVSTDAPRDPPGPGYVPETNEDNNRTFQEIE